MKTHTIDSYESKTKQKLQQNNNRQLVRQKNEWKLLRLAFYFIYCITTFIYNNEHFTENNNGENVKATFRKYWQTDQRDGCHYQITSNMIFTHDIFHVSMLSVVFPFFYYSNFLFVFFFAVFFKCLLREIRIFLFSFIEGSIRYDLSSQRNSIGNWMWNAWKIIAEWVHFLHFERFYNVKNVKEKSI